MGFGKSVLSELLQGEVYRAFVGTGKPRPVVVVSQSQFNRGHYCLAIPFTTARLTERRRLPSCVYFRKGSFGLTKACVAQAEAMTLLRKSELVQPVSRLGRLSQARIADLVSAVGHVIGADCNPVPVSVTKLDLG